MSGAVRAAALHAALTVLACPVCRRGLEPAGTALRCAAGHAFDVAKQGYAALATGAAASGDTAPMVRARAEFLAAGHFDAIAAAVVATVRAEQGWCIDLAGGTGHYLARVLDAHPDLRGIGVDTSAAAARAAAAAHPRAASVTADVWQAIPVRDGGAAHVLDVFGPRNGAEIARILAPGGRLTVVTPAPGHLAELRERFGPLGMLGIAQGKEQRLDAQLAPLALVDRSGVDVVRQLPAADAARAVLMGPSGHHVDAADVARAAGEAPIATTIAVTVSVFARP